MTNRVHLLQVHDKQRISPGFMRIALTGDAAFESDFRPAGFDQWFRLFLPLPGQEEPELPHGPAAGWYRRWKAQPQDVRPIVRNYTVRASRRSSGQVLIEVDFALHEHTAPPAGPATRWAQTARIGDRVGFLDHGRT